MIRSIVLVSFFALTVARANDPVVMPTVASPPVSIEQVVLIEGTAVSRPLQPVSTQDPAPASLPAATTTAEAEVESITLPRSWSRYDLLMWFPKAQPIPPLLTVAPPGGFPAIGVPGTDVLIGGQSIDTPMSTGGRFTWGWSSGDERELGTELTYLFTGSRAARASADGTLRPLTLGRPVFDAANGVESAFPVSLPGLPGRFQAVSVNRMQGWEANVVANLYRSENAHLLAFAGYRYFMVHEGLRVNQLTSIPGGAPGGGNMLVDLADQFDGHTRFHGGQLGFEASGDWNRLFAEVIGKVGLGRSFQVVKIGGQTNLIVPGGGGAFPGGVLALPSNTGRYTNSAFAVLPEVQFNVGYRFRDRSRFFIGYNAIYLSEAVRPGDQIDRSIPTTTVPYLTNGRAVPHLRPAFTMNRTDFWVQGLVMGLEYKY